MAIVAIAKQEDYNPQEVRSKLEAMLFGILELVRGKSVLIKPNCTGTFSPEEGRTPHPIVLEKLVEILHDVNADIIIGESSTVGTDTLDAYEQTGVKEVAEKLGIGLIDFKKSRYHEISIDGIVLNKILLPEEILNRDYVISLAKMKTNYVTRISCSMKNMKGLLLDWQKREFHRIGVSEAVVDLYSVLQNQIESIAIIDGILGSELYEPREGGVLVASADFVACDSVCAEIMGVNPADVRHLKLGHERGLGEIDSNKMELYGDAIFSVHPAFRSNPPGLEYISREFGVEIIDGNPCSGCIGGLYHGLKKIKMTRPELLKEGLRIAVGDCGELSNTPKTIHYGLCAHENSNNRLYVVGCPPTSSEMIKALEKIRWGGKNG